MANNDNGERKNGNGLKLALGKIALQLVLPAIAAGAGGYLAVAVSVARLEERIKANRQYTDGIKEGTQRDISNLQATDRYFYEQIALLRNGCK